MEQTIIMEFEKILENEEIREWVANVLEIHYGNPLVFRDKKEDDPIWLVNDGLGIEEKLIPTFSELDEWHSVVEKIEEIVTEDDRITEVERAKISSEAQNFLSVIDSDKSEISLLTAAERTIFVGREFKKLCKNTTIVSTNYALLEAPFHGSIGYHNWFEDCLAYFASEFYGKKVTRDDTDTIDKFTTEEDYTFFFSDKGLHMIIT